MNLYQKFTAAAVAEALGFPAGAQVFAAPRASTTEDWDPAEASFEQLEQAISQHEKLISNIRANAEGGALSERDEGRLAQAEESLAVIQAEFQSRGPNCSRAQLDARNSAMGRRSTPDAMPGSKPDASEAASRAGIVFNVGERNFSAKLFPKAVDPWAGKTEEFFAAVGTRTFDPRFLQNATGTEGVGVDGGYSVPGTWFRGVIDQGMQEAEYAPRCRIFPCDGNTLSIPLLDITNQSAGVAGIRANWSTEAGLQTAQVLTWTATELKLNKTFILAEASNELVEDGISYESQLTGSMTAATGQTLDLGILYGTGVGQPVGLINHGSAISIAPESGQAADSVLWLNLVGMWARLTPASRKRATWFVSSALLPSLMAVKVPGTEAPALLSGGQNDAGAGAPAMSIFGRPVVMTDVNAVPGDAGDIVLADLTQYALLMKRSARIDTDQGPGFARDVQTFRMVLRVGGQPLWKAPITPLNGGPTLSWATYLAAR